MSEYQAVIAFYRSADKFLQELKHQLSGLAQAAEAARAMSAAGEEMKALAQRKADAEAAVVAAQARASKADAEAIGAEGRLANIRAKLVSIESKLKADLAAL